MANSLKSDGLSDVSTPNAKMSPNENSNGGAQLQKGQRHKSLTSPILSPQDIAQEILERSKRKHPQRLPEGGDVIFTMKLAHRLAKRVIRTKTNELNNSDTAVSPSKTQKAKEESKTPDLDARELLSILQDGAETHYLDTPPKQKAPRLYRGPYKTDSKLDPELEKKLALKQLMEFSRKRGRPKKLQEDNNNEVSKPEVGGGPGKPPKKRSRGENRELEMLLQDEGAINMLYAIEKRDTEIKAGLLPSKRRMKKALLKKAQEVKQAILGGAAHSGFNLRHRASPTSDNKPRKLSVDSVDSEHSENRDNFAFPSPAEASKIIRRHSSSSSYSSRSNSPSRRLSIDHEKSPPLPVSARDIQSNKIDSSPPQPPTSRSLPPPEDFVPDRIQAGSTPVKQVRISEKTEKLIELKCKELKLMPEHSEMIKQLIQQNKNGLKERLQSDIATKLKAGVTKHGGVTSSSASPTKPDKTKSTLNNHADSSSSTEVSSTEKTLNDVTPPSNNSKKTIASSVKSAVWKMVEEDWLTDDVEPIGEMTATGSPDTPTQLNSDNTADNTDINNHETPSTPLLEMNASISLDEAESECFVRQLDAGNSSHAYKELQLRRIQNLVQVNIAPVSTYLPQAFNSQVLRELTSLLEELSQDTKCHAILLTCHGSVFSNGLDLPALLHQKIEIRKNVATEMATALKQLVCKLCMVRKPVIAGVNGRAIGLGVVLLAYCDLVLATEESTFYTPYTTLGYVPEAAATLALPHAVGHRWASKLLLGCSKMSAAEAHQCGLVTELLPAENFNRELLASVLPIANNSLQSMETTKALLLHQLRSRIGSVLTLEVSMLRQHWTSDECQARIRSWASELTSASPAS